RNRGTSGKRLRYFLARIERQLSGADISDEAMTATVEHILPENPPDSDWTDVKPDARERCVERLGNYSLLERNLNSREASNLHFSDKVSIYSKSQYKTSKELCDYSEWTEEAINIRQVKMAKVAKTVWAIQT
ncbi:MAG: HNH endonuclease family protein, partial [Planctomycetota bacterium]